MYSHEELVIDIASHVPQIRYLNHLIYCMPDTIVGLPFAIRRLTVIIVYNSTMHYVAT